MAQWLLLALTYSLLLSLVVHIDKNLVEEHFLEYDSSVLVIISSLVGIPVTIILLLAFRPDVLAVPLDQILVLVVAGALLTGGLLPYFKALEYEEASVVAPLSLLIPVFALLLGFVLLGELPTTLQLAAGGIIIMGSFILSLEIKSLNDFSIKQNVLILMSLFSLAWAVNNVMFKAIALETDLATTLFWEYFGVLPVAGYLLTRKRIRKDFISAVRDNGPRILSLNAVNETLAVLAQISFHVSTLMAPVALVSTVGEGFQALFVFFLGIVLTILGITQEKITGLPMVLKLVGIPLMILGGFLIV